MDDSECFVGQRCYLDPGVCVAIEDLNDLNELPEDAQNSDSGDSEAGHDEDRSEELCTEQDNTCDGDRLIICNDGIFEESDCLYGCNEERLKCNDCVPGLKQCIDGQAIECSEIGIAGRRISCDFGKVCEEGVCECVEPYLFSGEKCVDIRRDPLNCGAVGHICDDAYICLDETCVCRPGLTLVNDSCVDLKTNSRHCGAPDDRCDEICIDGDCEEEDECPRDTDRCDSGCVDKDEDPLNCGDCGNRCAVNEICDDERCVEFIMALCDACPCESCSGRFSECQTYPESELESEFVICSSS